MRHNLEEEFFHPESVVEVITLAHKYAMQDEQLGFFTVQLQVLMLLRQMCTVMVATLQALLRRCAR